MVRACLHVETGKWGLVDLTDRLSHLVQETGVAEGAVFCFLPHTTAGLTLNENWDPDVLRDLALAFDVIAPKLDYAHGEGNSRAHLLSSLMGASLWIPIAGGRLGLGQWQGVFLAEFDGPRRRRVEIQVWGGAS